MLSLTQGACRSLACAQPARSLRAQLRGGARLGPSNGFRVAAFFNFRIVGAQDRDQYEKVDVEYYFNYMGCLAVEGTYDRMYKLVDAGLHPIDIILLFAAAEADLPKIEEICEAGADLSVKDLEGNTPLMLAGKSNPAKKDECIALLQSYMKK